MSFAEWFDGKFFQPGVAQLLPDFIYSEGGEERVEKILAENCRLAGCLFLDNLLCGLPAGGPA